MSEEPQNNLSTTRNGHASLPMRQASHEGDPEANATPPWVKLHAMLRGRYLWAVPLVGVLAILGAVGGWFSATPVYTSEGLIEIKPRVEAILFQTDDSAVMPMFDNFVETQTRLMSNARVVDMAMSSEAWNRVAGPGAASTTEAFTKNLTIDRERRSNLIAVRYTHPEPEPARVAADQIIDAYMQLYGEQDVASDTTRLNVLTSRRDRLSNQLSQLEQQVRGLAEEFATDSLQTHYQAKFEAFQDIERARRDTELALTAAGVDVENIETSDAPELASEEEAATDADENLSSEDALAAETATYEEAAVMDKSVQRALDTWRQAQRRLETVAEDFGESHRAYKQAQSAVEQVKASLELAMASYRNRVAMGEVGGDSEINIPRLRQQYQQLLKLEAEARAEYLAIGRKNLDIENLKREIEDVREKLAQVKLEIDKINVERAAAGRVQVISEARVPEKPSSARKKLVVLGFGGGGMAGAVLVLGLAFLDRRVRYSDEVMPAHPAAGDIRALGILPSLPPNPETREQSESTAYAVHHIRTLLQVGYRGGPATAITGPVSGSGKTSLTVALGLSFASTGDQTLLIDADFIGSGLTRRMEGFRRERLGEILVRTQAIDETQLEQAIEHARAEHQRLGEALVDLGIVTEDEIEHGLSLQRESCPGLLEALRGGSACDSIAETGVPHLHILPLLNGSASQVAAANPDAVGRVLREVAEHYRHVLIDLGPVPGSVEASVLAAAADRTVLVVSRGDAKPRYDCCVEFLRSLGTPLAGVVFNRAGEADMHNSNAFSSAASTRSAFSRNSRSHSGSRSRPVANGNGHAHTDRFGPLGAGVASQNPENDR